MAQYSSIRDRLTAPRLGMGLGWGAPPSSQPFWRRGDASATPTASAYLTQDPTQLATETNAFMTQQAQAPFLANLPGYAAMNQQRSATLAQQMAGEVPTDVVNQILQQAAERGIATGSPGGPGSNAAFLRALGLTSMGLQQQGMAGFSQAIADTPVPELLNPASIMVPERFAAQEEAAYLRSLNPRPTGRPGQTFTPNTGWAPQITPWRA